MAQVLGIPIDNDSGQQVETCHAVVLALSAPITDFALAANAKGVFQGVMRLALIQTNIGTALHIGIEQPVDDEQRTLYAPDFPERQGKFMLTWIL